MDESIFRKGRIVVWEIIIEFFCYEYCAFSISKSKATDYSFRITSEILRELNDYQTRENDSPSFYQLLALFLMKSNKLLEEDSFGKKNIKEECTELLEELCSMSSKLKPVGKHLSNLLENKEGHGVHSTEEEVEEWRNVFVGSRTVLVKEILEILDQPYLLKMIQNCNLDYTVGTNKGVNAAVDVLKSMHFEAKNIENWKKKLKEDEILVEIMKNNSTNKKQDKEAASIPEHSHETNIVMLPEVASTVSSSGLDFSRKITKQVNRHRTGEQNSARKNIKSLSADKSAKRNVKNRKTELITSHYFATPQPLPKLRIRKPRSSFLRNLSERKKPPSSISNSTTSRSHNGVSRKRLSWTHEEEELLVLGVEKYGVGNWKFILSDGGLEDRTVRDLYDKWKNIQKYGHLNAIKDRLRCKHKSNQSD